MVGWLLVCCGCGCFVVAVGLWLAVAVWLWVVVAMWLCGFGMQYSGGLIGGPSKSS